MKMKAFKKNGIFNHQVKTDDIKILHINININRKRGQKDNMLKKDVGIRFKAFRTDQKKPQHAMAGELKVHQSTITNIEHGTTFPKISYLYYFFENYGLNVHWLVTGEGHMYLTSRDRDGHDTVLHPNVHYGDVQYDQYMDLIHLMQVPVIEQVILAKLAESKFIFKDELEKWTRKKKEEREAAKKRTEAMLLAEQRKPRKDKKKKKVAPPTEKKKPGRKKKKT